METQKWATRAKRKQAERLSERDGQKKTVCDSLNTGITKEASEGDPKRLPRHRKMVSSRKAK
ncbi:MAG: hypothetical protein EBW12_05530 [Actinobacteria bacterium]|nr:hypothetical protein [Actinomycetota bacterium]